MAVQRLRERAATIDVKDGKRWTDTSAAVISGGETGIGCRTRSTLPDLWPRLCKSVKP
jgi:hypothetical protein